MADKRRRDGGPKVKRVPSVKCLFAGKVNVHYSQMAADPPGVFDQAALEAVKHWRYEPFILEGVPTPIPDRVVFRFDPKSA